MEYYAYTYKSDKAFVHRIFWCIITLDVQIKCTIFNPLSAETKLALLPISSSSKKKEKSRSFPLRSNESSSRIHGTLADRARSYATRQVGHERATIPTPEGRLSRRYRDSIYRLHRNTRVIFMDSWPAPVPSPYFPETRGSTRPREEIRA